MVFKKKFDNIVAKNNSLVCVGLDPDNDKLKTSLFIFNKKIIDETYDLVCAYKPNIAFYEANGIKGLLQLKKTIEYLKNKYPYIPIILDAKRGDIGNTARMYAKSVFDYWNADAVTVFPHLGKDSLEPFLKYKNKLTIVLLKTSNPDSETFQNVITSGVPYYLKMAREIKKWNYKNIGIFVGATQPQEMKKVRQLFPRAIILSAGIGTQGGNIKAAVKAGINSKGKGIIFNSSRSIIYSNNPRQAALKLKNEINEYR